MLVFWFLMDTPLFPSVPAETLELAEGLREDEAVGIVSSKDCPWSNDSYEPLKEEESRGRGRRVPNIHRPGLRTRLPSDAGHLLVLVVGSTPQS